MSKKENNRSEFKLNDCSPSFLRWISWLHKYRHELFGYVLILFHINDASARPLCSHLLCYLIEGTLLA